VWSWFNKMLKEEPVTANTADLNGNTGLMEACLKGHLSIVKLLLLHSPYKLKINQQNVDDRAALHKATYNGNCEIIELLLNNGADPTLLDASGNEPIDYVENPEARLLLIHWNVEWTK
jgi:ankyrin repeat protein